MKRTPEAYGLYQRLKILKLDSQNNEFEDIIQEVIGCIEKGAETREKVIKTRSGLQQTNFLNEANRVIEVIKMNSTSLGHFLNTILRVYTMETFVCYWLNELLRSENWEEINVLTPFLVCLVYTFKRSEYIIKYQEPQGLMNSLFAIVGKQKLTLYRGTALTREYLGRNNPDMIKYFSWNGVTSTSREKNVALNFIRASLEKSKSFNEPKVGVLFVIEADFGSPEDCEGMIDVFQNSCSQFPDEQEVILSPGTVFKLLKTRLIEKGIYEVNLRVKRKFEETKKKIALLGSLQDQSILKEKAIIEGLPSQQSCRLLEMLKGNRLILKLEIRNSGIEEYIMEEIENLRATTNMRKEDVILRNNTIVIGSLNDLVHYFSLENLNEILSSNKIRFKEGKTMKDKEVKIKTLIFNEECLKRFKQNDQLKELKENITSESLDLAIPYTEDLREWIDFLQCIRESQGLQSLQLKINEASDLTRENLKQICQTIGSSGTISQLNVKFMLSDKLLNGLKETLELIASIESLSLDLQFKYDIENSKLTHLKNGLGSLSNLQCLSLNFNGRISDEGLSGLVLLSSLQSLSMNFSGCKEITNKGLCHLGNSLISLKSLKDLSLNFFKCNKVSDEGLGHLKGGLLSLESLHNLSLNFGWCNEISDEGLSHLENGLVSLPSLKHLDLKFEQCDKISDEGLSHLESGFLSFPSLQYLSLDCSSCNRISDEGLKHLKRALLSFSSLQHLSLNFFECEKISDEGINQLSSGLLSLSSLQHLSLNFFQCNKISDFGLSYVKIGLKSLISLRHLDLVFWGCNKISSEGLNHLKNGVLSLKSLQHLSLNLAGCSKIADEGLSHLRSGLVSLTSLRHLYLNFYGCEEISDEGLNYLKSGIVSLTSLWHFDLTFESRQRITNKGLGHLGSGLGSLTSLQHLSLSFYQCIKISDEGLSYLKTGLIKLTALQHLSMNFYECEKISDEGLSHLKSSFLPLSSLQHLSLEFWSCNKISDEGLNHLKNLLTSLTLLQHLILKFISCNRISDKGVNYLKSGLVSHTSLQQLSLTLTDCKNVSDKGVEALRNQFKFIRSVEISHS